MGNFIKMAKDFAKDNVEPIAKDLDLENRFPSELIKPMSEKGFFGIHYPKKYGGFEESALTSFTVVREISKASAGLGLLYLVHWMACDSLLKFGTDKQKEEFLTDMVCGKKIATFAISEGVAGSDASSISTVAEKVHGGYKLNGSKYFCTNGLTADLYFVAAKTDKEAGSKGISMFIIPKDASGVRITQVADKMGCRSSSTTNLVFNDCFISDESLIGEENKGFKIAMYGLVTGRLGMVAMGLGIGQAAMEKSASYANNRIAFGKPLAKLYSIQEKIANMHIKLQAAETLFEKACILRDKDQDYTELSSVAKIFTAEAINEITFDAVQIYGGHGYYKNSDVERYFRDGRLMDIGVGSSEVLKMVVGGSVLKEYK